MSYLGFLVVAMMQTITPGTPVTINANATDNVGVVGVQFKLDGANLGAEQVIPPYATVWNATAGIHSLTAIARDAAGNTATAAPVNVTVTNPPPQGDTVPPTITFLTPNGASFNSNDVTVRVAPRDANAVVCVELFRAGFMEHIVANCESDLRRNPVYLRWQAVGIPPGTYNLTAIATDAAGNKSVPATVTVIRK